MKIGIIGSGFGIYGWLNSFISLKNIKVCTLSRYKKKIKQYKNKIIYFRSLKELINNIDTLVIAKRPIDQEKIIKLVLKNKRKKNLILEKPLCKDPESSIKIFHKILKKKLNFSTGLISKNTNWSEDISILIKKKKVNHVSIKWFFNAHHYKNNLVNWKKYYKDGGGSLNFFAIHLIYWISCFGKFKIQSVSKNKKKNEDPDIRIKLKNHNLNFDLTCKTNSLNFNYFKIIGYKKSKKVFLKKLKNPFDLKKKIDLDPRTVYLKRQINDILKNKWENYKNFQRFLNLWKDIYKKHQNI